MLELLLSGRHISCLMAYDGEGNITLDVYPSNLLVRYPRNPAGNVLNVQKRINVPDPQTGQYPPYGVVVQASAYQPFGPVYWREYGNGQIASITYDQSYRATKYLDTFGQTTLRDVRHNYTLRDNMGYSYNALDNNETRDSGYNSREQLTSADGPWGNLDYTYDSVGNRLSRLLNGNTDSYTYPATKNRLQSVAGVNARVFTYVRDQRLWVQIG